MNLPRNARTLGILAALLIASLPSAAASHHPAHVSECDPWDVVNEIICVTFRNPISKWVFLVFNDAAVAAGKFGGKILEATCELINDLLPVLRSNVGTIIRCPWTGE